MVEGNMNINFMEICRSKIKYHILEGIEWYSVLHLGLFMNNISAA